VKDWWRSRSIRVRLTLSYVTATIAVLAMYAIVVGTAVRRHASDSLDAQIGGDFLWASAMVDQRPDGTITWYDDDEDRTPVEERPWLQVWSPDGQLLYRNAEAERRPLEASQALALAPPSDGRIVRVPTPSVPVRVLSRGGRISTRPVVIQVARSEAAMREELGDLMFILVFGLPLAAAVAGFCGYVLARRALGPVHQMTERARWITAERLHDRLPVDNPDDEMGRLATVFNETLGHLESSFGQMRRFTADVSHQLRTPLTAIRTVGEVGLRDRRDAVAYRGIIGSMLEEVDHLSGLVDRLLTLSRAESGQARLTADEIDLRELAEEVSSHLGVLADEKRQSIHIEASGLPRCRGDRLVLRQAFVNLVHNAILYGPEGGSIRLGLAESSGRTIVDITDTGPGIPAETHERLFERFGAARGGPHANGGGTGLGLSIAQWAVEANGGRLTLEATGATGTAFRISLPGIAAGQRRRATAV
jgi:heavy metal sensor kinase